MSFSMYLNLPNAGHTFGSEIFYDFQQLTGAELQKQFCNVLFKAFQELWHEADR